MTKVLISIPDELLQRVDREARARRSSRSSLVSDALRRELSRRDPARIDEAIAQGRAALAGLGPISAAGLIRDDRDERDARDRHRL